MGTGEGNVLILLSPEIKEAPERAPTTRTVAIDLTTHEDLTAGQSVIMIDNQRYGVVRYERRGHMASAVLVRLETTFCPAWTVEFEDT